MRLSRSSAFDIKRPNGKLSGFGQLVLGCFGINLESPLFIVSTKVINYQLGEFDQQFITFSAESISDLFNVLEDEKDERFVYVVSCIANDPSNGMRIDRLREIWCANDAKYPLVETMIYVLEGGDQFIRQKSCDTPVEALGESRLLVRV